MTVKTDDLRILGMGEVIAPEEIHKKFLSTENAQNTVHNTRQEIHKILTGEDDRLIIIIGPCSIHDVKAAREYAHLIKTAREKLQDDLLIIMRVYFEKPRTTVGWKGLINDPELDDSFQINKGLGIARDLLVSINDLGVPTATEFLDLISPQYVADLISWGAIGARTTESQVHRELASGLSCPVGFKNATDGGVRVAIDAIASASRPHVFLSVTKQGKSAIFNTSGNLDCHIILRGGTEANYDATHVEKVATELQDSNTIPNLMIDFSHANSQKQFKKQIDVAENVSQQVAEGDKRIIGAMIESNLVEGRQNCSNKDALVYGQSITDACINWEDSFEVLTKLSEAVQQRRVSLADE
ncbi:MAG: 3-deoxy-7-phosphoheptulonate synthase AroG [gamma proteobacterium symbiont of Lucinoma myriamae]|nr:3-deoxy-7-phosphoheptulonate synthase AroG [gamma proteobacterium symbiont of Lucinoma myriamae]MCU7817348.1 3-deoxy-7-phosphoheptulonate synthase AroG [gamma proteobacterium symbiont of Lucinoma myriamae]